MPYLNVCPFFDARWGHPIRTLLQREKSLIIKLLDKIQHISKLSPPFLPYKYVGQPVR